MSITDFNVSGKFDIRRLNVADKFPRLASVYGYQAGDRCCRRRCTPLSRCGHNQYGCQDNQDCLPGHRSDWTKRRDDLSYWIEMDIQKILSLISCFNQI